MSMGLIGGVAVAAAVVLWFFLRKPTKKQSSTAGFRPRSQLSSKSAPVGTAAAGSPAGSHDAATAAPPRLIPEELASLTLLTVDDGDQTGRDRVRQICEDMADPHPVHRQLAGGLDTPEELIEVVTSDAGLTAGILRTVNSAAYALASPITSVQHAITYLGVSAVKGLVAQAALAERETDGTREQQLALARIWRSAGVASGVAQMLGQELGLNRPSVLATKALFFNLGDVALALSVDEAPAWYEEGVSITQRIRGQQAACATNTAIVGAALARHWNLPKDIADAIEQGFLPLQTPPSVYPLEGDARSSNVLVYLAGRIGDRVAYRGLRDIGALAIEDSEEPGLFYLAEHLRAAGLGRALDVLRDQAFRRKVNRLLQALAG